VPTDVHQDRFGSAIAPYDFVLNQNYPNPFNPKTIITFSLPKENFVRLEVLNLLGECIATLVNERITAGSHSVNFDASNLSSGMYIYRMVSGGYFRSMKLTVMK